MKLMEFMVSRQGRSEIHADANFEYPVEPGIKLHRDGRLLRRAEARHAAARRDRQVPQGGSELVDKVGFDN